MRTRAAVAAAVLAVVAVVTGAVVWATRGDDAPPGWSTAVATPPGKTGDAAVAGDGTVVAAWIEERRGMTAVMSADRPPGGAWSDPVAIQPPQPWGALLVSVSAGPRGDAAVTFRLLGRRGGRGIVLGAYRPAGGSWEAPQPLTRVGAGYGDLAAAVDAAGGVTVATAAVGTGTHLDASVRDPDGPWTDPIELARGVIVARPAIAMTAGGRAYVATIEAIGHRRTVLRLHARRDGGWRPVRLPTDAGQAVGAVALAAGGDGAPVVAWARRGTDGATTVATSTLRDGTWTPTQVLDRGPLATTFGALAATPASGGVVVAWTRWQREWTRVAVRASAVRDGHADPSAVVDAFDIPDVRAGADVSTPGPPPTHLSVSRSGTPVLMWDRLVGRAPSFAGRLYASRAGLPGRWSPPQVVQESPTDGWPLAVGADGDHLAAAWADYVSPATGGMRVLASERFG
jgi:hypothetical protein